MNFGPILPLPQLLPRADRCAIIGPLRARRWLMAKKRRGHHLNPDLRHRVPGPLPLVADVEAELRALLTPALLAPRLLERHDPRNPERVIRMRARLLTLPVMVALIVSLVWRRLGAIAEVARVLAQDGLLWVAPLRVSEQAIAKRLDTLPARALAEVFTEVSARLQAQASPAWPGRSLKKSPDCLALPRRSESPEAFYSARLRATALRAGTLPCAPLISRPVGGSLPVRQSAAAGGDQAVFPAVCN